MTSKLCQAIGAPIETTISISEMAIARYRENIKKYEQQPDQSEQLNDQRFLLNNACSIYIDQLAKQPSLLTEERKVAIKAMAQDMQAYVEARRKTGQDHVYFSGYEAVIKMVETMKL